MFLSVYRKTCRWYMDNNAFLDAHATVFGFNASTVLVPLWAQTALICSENPIRSSGFFNSEQFTFMKPLLHSRVQPFTCKRGVLATFLCGVYGCATMFEAHCLWILDGKDWFHKSLLLAMSFMHVSWSSNLYRKEFQPKSETWKKPGKQLVECFHVYPIKRSAKKDSTDDCRQFILWLHCQVQTQRIQNMTRRTGMIVTTKMTPILLLS